MKTLTTTRDREDTPMTEPARTPDSEPDTARRWVRVVMIVAVIAVLLVVVVLLIGGGGGHGPSRHF
jgi:uncharacterized membrane protein YdfJ with MMPL/SSD domain